MIGVPGGLCGMADDGMYVIPRPVCRLVVGIRILRLMHSEKKEIRIAAPALRRWFAMTNMLFFFSQHRPANSKPCK